MRRVLAACLLALLPALAGAAETVGRVVTLYYEAGRGVLVDAKFLHRPHAVRWADVDTSTGRILVQLADGIDVAPGDRVLVRLADPLTSPLAQVLPALAVNRVLEAGDASVGR